ncbi:UDP-N-acetylmuramate dehydrogenase [Alkalilimnicola ehrlichii MLHE-1]|uniref:UDP-N-acetylenolpyruvoylglucosamine reductase n=1 Tax=Alkalilimnicola ehrlichii (strain ATCC BAA-1101 / DSM 17681 / MLHE-1) TaxID=187272 RepID=MURB_ALKEH|nr:UDP-N-acetylmuramate dehydrogenase [Alkalilimnicola ehrlichii]Q0A6K4.1 RecName: Full=UDP-N-acetylenolpyruvoylglucosamine reductase; AltName: Full=UDP-N-acetylmuramate dehydrogenase [Alkalilimnicola ehrlichii MLHE-1]ABI57533.1 UDP-N-acetylmuramate dehydrogenase [Alkalilimnicola ehrlichii MLHE-1]
MMAAERRIQPGELRHWEPMARYTSWRAGGPAERLYRPAGLADLVAFLRRLPEDEPLFWCGLGSNLLVREGGLRGTVILTQGGLDALRVEGEQVHAEAGVACGRLSRYCIRQGLAGAEFFAGIPGTLGGALAMNAGAFGGETWSRVRRVETVDRHGVLRRRGPEDFRVGYRHVSGPAGEWFVAAVLDLEPGDAQAMQARVKALLSQRNRTQPIGEPSCGSVFRNPPGDHAARLIEAAGLKGLRRGAAQVSERHANFIINTGGATPADIEALIEQVRDEVARRHGVTLVPEVHIVGEAQS